ncbi:MAG TPA: hypothetical protein GXZ30_04605 [Propionibacterium sp.]|jgi:hypothetical protein|nr:hypothetical protein [Propionibacterium sp.]
MEALTLAEPGQGVAWAAGLVGSMVRKWVLPAWGKLSHFFEDWFGEPARPGVKGAVQ